MLRLGLALVTGLTLAACGDTADDKENPRNANGSTAQVGALSDAELVGILEATIAANSAMASAGGRVTNDNVRAMVEAQNITATNARANVERVATDLGIAGVDTDFSTGIISASRAQVTELGAVADTGYDDAFLVSVSDAQASAADAFANDFAGSGSPRIASLMTGMGQALTYESGYASALQGGYDASAFLAANPSPNSAGIGSVGGGSSTSGTGGGTGGGSGTGSGDTGSGTGSGSGSDGGLGGDGTDTGNGQDPGGSVGTGNPNDGGGLGGDGTDTGAGDPP